MSSFVNGKRSQEAFLATHNASSKESNKVPAILLLSIEETPMGRLSTEELLKILNYLSLEDILNFKLVCSFIRNVCHLELESLASRSENRSLVSSISCQFSDSLIKRIIAVGVSKLVNKITLHDCPQDNKSIEDVMSQFPHLTHLFLHKEIRDPAQRHVVWGGPLMEREINITVINSIDHRYDFSQNTFLRSISFIVNHKWPYDRSDISGRSLYVITSIGSIEIKQSEIKTNKETLIEIDSVNRVIRVSFNIIRHNGEIFCTHKKTFRPTFVLVADESI